MINQRAPSRLCRDLGLWHFTAVAVHENDECIPVPRQPSTRHPSVRITQKINNQPIEGTDIYVALVFSCQELPDLQELHKLVPDAKIVCFNLRMDTLRGDLGLPAFPPKVTFLRSALIQSFFELKRHM